MEFLSKIIQNIFGLSLSGKLAVIFAVFVLICVASVIWGLYYAFGKRAVNELSNISWLSLKDTVKYSTVTIVALVVSSGVLFAYDFLLDKVVKVIINNAK